MTDFKNVKYETDSGAVCRIKLDILTIPQAGSEPGGTVDIPVSAVNGGSSRRSGIHARKMNLAREVGAAPNTFNKYKRVALLTPDAYVAAAALVGTTVAIGGFTWTISSLTAEKVK